MTINVAVQKGRSVYVYDDRNRMLFSNSRDLHGYTSSTVSIRQGSSIYTYDQRGRPVSSHAAGR